MAASSWAAVTLEETGGLEYAAGFFDVVENPPLTQEDRAFAIEALHRVKATYEGCLFLNEKLNDEIVWKGQVDVFSVEGHLEAKRAFGWEETEDGLRHYRIELAIPPITTAREAIRDWHRV
jgi:hypothetical protein